MQAELRVWLQKFGFSVSFAYNSISFLRLSFYGSSHHVPVVGLADLAIFAIIRFGFFVLILRSSFPSTSSSIFNVGFLWIAGRLALSDSIPGRADNVESTRHAFFRFVRRCWIFRAD